MLDTYPLMRAFNNDLGLRGVVFGLLDDLGAGFDNG